MRILAMYLPQFHRIPENDLWWGEGFTEWTAVKKAKPLYEGHSQPKKPLDGKYYDLLDKETMKWQSELMHKYGIDGMCIYHYWFKDGRRILEQPEQNLLKWKDINMPFCFCWANETWANTWCNIGKAVNTWADVHEIPMQGKNDGILMQQEYGMQADWKAHFYYLLPFFLDDRYVRLDGKPVIVLYRTDDIGCLSEMLTLWRQLAIENDLPGLFVIGGECRKELNGVIDGQLYRQPARSISRLYLNSNDICERPIRYSYINFCRDLLSVQSEYEIQPFFCGLTGFDNTPRRGNKGLVLEHNSPELFGEMLTALMEKNKSFGSNITFINAWNEWGEGMYLEPDEENGFGYLEELLRKKKEFIDREKTEKDDKHEIIRRLLSYSYREYRDLAEKNRRASLNIDILSAWLIKVMEGKSLIGFISDREWESLAIYGYGVLGKLLTVALGMEGIRPSYIVENRQNLDDKNELKFISHKQKLPKVDVMIVTAIMDYEQIKEKLLEEGFQGEIVSIGELQ